MVAIKNVNETQDLIITTTQGVIIRMHVSDLRVMGRATQGVRLIRLDEGDEIGDVAVIDREEELAEEIQENENPIISPSFDDSEE